MPKPKYSPDDFELVKKDEKNPGETTIQRINITNEFQLKDIDSQVQYLEKLKKEATAQRKVCGSFMDNVSRNYEKLIKSLSEEAMHAVHMYYENLKLDKDTAKKLREINKQLKDYKEIKSMVTEKFNLTEKE